MVQEIDTNLLADTNDQYVVVVSRFNDLVTNRLLDGAVTTLARHGLPRQNITIVRAPGSFELPLLADRLAKTGNYAAIICLGAVIQGETTHHEYINHQVAAGMMQSGLETGVPILFGVLTCGDLDQALNRAGGKAGNKGDEAALAAIEMVNTLRAIEHGGK